MRALRVGASRLAYDEMKFCFLTSISVFRGVSPNKLMERKSYKSDAIHLIHTICVYKTIIIKFLNQIISENKPHNLCLWQFTLLNFKRKIWTWTGTRTRTSRSLALLSWQLLQEESLKVNSQENQDSSMVERQTSDLEVRVPSPDSNSNFSLQI